MGSVLPGLKGGEGDVGKISVAEDWVILYSRLNIFLKADFLGKGILSCTLPRSLTWL